MLNIELKARCDDLGVLRRACEALGADGQEPDRQVDTYFRAASGRLKLRESSLTGAALIFYVRADVAAVRESHYQVCPVEEPEALKAILGGALGVRATVAKRREALEIGNVRIHLDKVQGLGSFVELEGTVADPVELAGVAKEVQELQHALGIRQESLVKESYADLIARAEDQRARDAR